MKHFAKILIPVDFSEGSNHAVRSALELESMREREVILYHVVEVTTFGMYGPESFWTDENLELIRKAAEEEMRKFIERTGTGSPFTVRIETSSREPAEMICEEARRSGADLIVLSTHGRSGWNRLLLGSVTKRVIRHAPCPVLTFRSPDPR
jgi:nucleotide-binding universal stress UspA family protein